LTDGRIENSKGIKGSIAGACFFAVFVAKSQKGVSS